MKPGMKLCHCRPRNVVIFNTLRSVSTTVSLYTNITTYSSLITSLAHSVGGHSIILNILVHSPFLIVVHSQSVICNICNWNAIVKTVYELIVFGIYCASILAQPLYCQRNKYQKTSDWQACFRMQTYLKSPATITVKNLTAKRMRQAVLQFQWLQFVQQAICKLSFVCRTQAKIKIKEYPVFIYKSGEVRVLGKDNNKSDFIYQQMTNLENASYHLCSLLSKI